MRRLAVLMLLGLGLLALVSHLPRDPSQELFVIRRGLFSQA